MVCFLNILNLRNMKLINITKNLAAVLLSVGMIMTSCSTDWPSYSPKSGDVTFQASAGSFTLSGTPVTVTLQRGSASAAEAIPVTLTDKNKVFTMASTTANFAAGSCTTDVQLTYTSSALTPGKAYEFTLAIDASKAAPGAISSTFDGTALLPFVWSDYGTLSLVGSSFWDDGDVPASYTLQTDKRTNNWYKIKNFYGGGTDAIFGVDTSTGDVTFTSPAASTYNGEEVTRFLTSCVSSKYGPYSCLIRAASTGKGPFIARAASYPLPLGAYLITYNWMVVSAGYFGNFQDNFRVTALK
jgi:hypothetical protein